MLENILTIPLFQNKYILSLILLVIVFLVSLFIVFVINKYLRIIASKTKTEVDDLIIEKTDKSLVAIFVIFGLKVVVLPLELSANFSAILNHILNSLVYVVLFHVVVVIIDILLLSWGKEFAKKTKSDIDDDLLPLIRRTSKVISNWN